MAIVKEKELIDFYFEGFDKNKFGTEPEIIDEGIFSWLGGKLGSVWGDFSKGFKEGSGTKEKISSAVSRIGDSSPEGLKKLKQFLSDQDIKNMDSSKLGEAMNAFLKKLSPEEQTQVIDYVTGKKSTPEKSTSDKLNADAEKPLTIKKGTKEQLMPILNQIQDGQLRGVANNAIQLMIAAARNSSNKEEFLKTVSMKLFKNTAETKKVIENNKEKV